MANRERLTDSELVSEYETELITDFSEMDLDLIREIVYFWQRQTKEDIYFRFFCSNPPCEAVYSRVLNNLECIFVTYTKAVDGRFIVGYAEAGVEREEPDWIELGIAVDKDFRKRGIAGRLCDDFASYCAKKGHENIKAHILPNNVPMLKLIQRLTKGALVTQHYNDGCIEYNIRKSSSG